MAPQEDVVLSLDTRLDSLRSQAVASIAKSSTVAELESVRVSLLGRQGLITNELKTIKSLPENERPRFGSAINQLKKELNGELTSQRESIQRRMFANELQYERIDVTLPSRSRHVGSLHPISQTFAEIEDMFIGAGYKVVSGPEIEDDYHNFQALNLPENHPARTMQDTFYLQNGLLLRTHTSPVQVRVMQSQQPPIRVICPGRVFRRDFDRTHTPMFHQVEGLCIDEGISFSNLKGTVIDFIQTLFSADVDIRFRPSYFPFTEPSAEVDVMGEDGWREVMGCGMVHPNVLSMSNIDPQRYSGFAFGFGVDRLAMLKFGINDLRLLFENDVRFLQQMI